MRLYLSAETWLDLQTSESYHQDGMMSHPTIELLKLQKAPGSSVEKKTCEEKKHIVSPNSLRQFNKEIP
jgi:hypothetical protein